MQRVEQHEGLSPKQSAFVDAYFRNNCNQVAAARAAGYSDPEGQAWRVFRGPKVQAALSVIWEQASLSVEEALARLSRQARGSLMDCISLDDEGTWKIDLKKAQETGAIHVIQEITSTAHGPRLKLYSAQEALALVLRYHALLANSKEEPETVGGSLWPSMQEAIKRVYGGG